MPLREGVGGAASSGKQHLIAIDLQRFRLFTGTPIYVDFTVTETDLPNVRVNMQRALSEFQVAGHGVRTTIPFHQRVMAQPDFRRGDVFTDFIERHMFQNAAA